MADDIEEARRADARRGRRPVDLGTLRVRQRLLAALREIWENGTEEDLKAAMREYGILEGAANWNEALAVWNAGRARS